MSSSENTIKNKVFSGLIWKFMERILSQVISFVISIILARLLSPDEYGIVSLVMIFITIANVFVTSGFGTALIQKKNASTIDFNTNFICSFVVSIFLYVVLFLVSPLIANFYDMPSLTLVLRIFSLRIIFNSYNSIQHAYVSKHMLFKKFFVSTLFGIVISGSVGILLALNGFGVWALVVQNLLSTVVDSIVLSITIPWKPKIEFSKKSSKSMMKYGSKILLADLIGTFFDQLRSLIIGKIYSSTDLAYYNKGKQLPSLVSDNVNVTIMSILFPALSESNDMIEKVKIMIKRATRVMVYVLCPMMFALCVMSEKVIVFLLTDKWIDCVFYARILCISSFFTILGNVSLQAIKAIGRSDVMLKLELYKKPVFLVLLIIGAFISVEWIAYTTIIYAIYSYIINAGSLSKLIKYNLKEQFKDIVLYMVLSLIMCCGMLVINAINMSIILSMILQFVVGCTIYFTLSYLFKCEEFYYLLNIIKLKLKGKNI